MAQQGSGSKRTQSGKQQGQPARTEPGSTGGREGEQYQQKDMGVHPAYGQHPRDPDGKDEDYGNRGLNRQAGTTKTEGLEDRGIGHAEDYDARYDAESSKPRREAREGRGVVSGQDTQERDAAKRRDPSGHTKDPSQGYSKVESDTDIGDGDLDISPGAAGGGKHSKRDPASR